MKNLALALMATTALTTAAHAGGIDRTGQKYSILFEEGTVLELSAGRVMPSVTGSDLAIYGGAQSGEVAHSYSQFAAGYKQQFNDNVSMALIFDQPFGADISYPAGQSFMLGGTEAYASADAITALLRYKFENNFSVYGGLRVQQASANVTLNGGAYGPFSGYGVDLDNDVGYGYSAGVSYEKPEIALRVALTYNSEVKHDMATTETMGNGAAVVATGTTTVNTPQSVNLDFQSGVAEDTLVFGSIRWADWSEFKLDPAFFVANTGGGLISLEDTFTYQLGIGRRFTDQWTGSLSITYEDGGNPLVSPLAPTNGMLGVTAAAVYNIDTSNKLSAGVNYTMLGDAQPETSTPDTARADFTNNDSWGVGLKFTHYFN